MQTARIYQRPKNAMQSGKARTDHWQLEFEPGEPKKADALTGWRRTPARARSEILHRAFELTGLDHALPLSATADEAMAGLQPTER